MKIQELIDKGCLLLTKYSRNEYGFYQQQIEVSGKPAAPTTANVILALYKAGKKDLSEYYINELLSLKDKATNLFCINEGLSVWATSKALITLLIVKPNLVNEEDVLALINLQNKNGGWGYRKDYASRAFYTYFVIKALTLFYTIRVESNIRGKIKNHLAKAKNYLLRSAISKGVWGHGNNPCPIETLMAVGGLKLIEECLKTKKLIDDELLENSYLVIKRLKEISDWIVYRFGESGIPFSIQPSPPDVIPVILEVYGKEEVSLQLIQWLLNNYKKFKDAIGWCPLKCGKRENPYVWTTALGILSLLEWLGRSEWKHPPAVKERAVINLMRQEAKISGFNVINSLKLKIILIILNVLAFASMVYLTYLFNLWTIIGFWYSCLLFIVVVIFIGLISAQLYFYGDIDLTALGRFIKELLKILIS